VARRYGVAPNLLYRWRRLLARVRELERLLGRRRRAAPVIN
jgi:transposase-like protein